MLETLRPRGEPGVPGETTGCSLLVRVFSALTQSRTSQTNLKRAEVAQREGREFRLDYHCAGGTGDSKAPYTSEQLKAYVEDNKTSMNVAAVVLAAICVQRTSGGQRTTVMGMIIGFILVWIGQVTSWGGSFLPKLGFGAHPTSVKKWVDKLASSYDRSSLSALKKEFEPGAAQARAVAAQGRDAEGAQRFTSFFVIAVALGFITDNLVVLQWPGHKKTGDSFTQITATMTNLAFVLYATADFKLNMAPDRPPAMPPTFDEKGVLVFFNKWHPLVSPSSPTMKLQLENSDWVTREQCPLDVRAGWASLRDHWPLRSSDAKSSLAKDLLNIVLPQFMRYHAEVLGEGNGREITIVVDPEPAYLFDILMMRAYDKVKHYHITLAVFHLQKHLLEDHFTDPCAFEIVYAPFLAKVMDYRAAHFAALLNKASRQTAEEAIAEEERGASDLTESMRNLNPLAEDEDDTEIRASAGTDERDLVDKLLDAQQQQEEEEEEEEVRASGESSATAAGGGLLGGIREKVGLWWSALLGGPDDAFKDANTEAGVKGLPSLGGSSGSSKKSSKINYGRLRFFFQLLFVAFEKARPLILEKVVALYSKLRPNAPEPSEEAALHWACEKAPMFLWLWNHFDNEMRMYMARRPVDQPFPTAVSEGERLEWLDEQGFNGRFRGGETRVVR